MRAFVGVLFDFCADNRGLLRIIDDAFRNRELVSFDVTQQALARSAARCSRASSKRSKPARSTAACARTSRPTR